MRIHIKITVAALTATLLLGAVASSWAASLGVSFIGRDFTASTPSSLPATAVAGVVPQPFWNNIADDGATFDGTTYSLLDSTGAFTGVRLTYEANDSWHSDGPTVTPNDILMRGDIKANPDPDLAPLNNSDRILFTITNLPAGNFKVIVYFTVDGTGAEGNVNVGGATTYYIAEENVFSGTFVRSTSTLPDPPSSGNYIQFDSVASVGGTVTISVRKTIRDPQQNTSVGVAAVQIEQLSGSAFPTNTQASSISAQPAAALTVEGSAATFSVGVTGPARVQWQKYGTNIVGATSTTYTTAATVLADNGTPIRAIVYNNINTNISDTVILSVDPNTPPVPTQGFLNVQRWTGMDPGAVTVDDTIAAESAGPPNDTFLVAVAALPDQGIDNFGAKMSGWVKPAVSGNYYFYLAADDKARLYLNDVAAASGTNALPDPATANGIAEKFTAGGFESATNSVGGTSLAIPLVAGKLYGLVAYLKENTGGDYLRIAWSTDANTPVTQLKPIAPTFLYGMATGAGQSSSITTQPKPVSVQVGRAATFTAAVTTVPAGGIYGIQWLKNGIAIPGANSTTYKISNALIGDNASMISAEFYTLDGVLTSTAVLFTVLPDTFPPVAAAGAITQSLPGGGSSVQVGVSFDENVNPAGLIAGNFTLNGGTGTFSLATNSLGTYTGVLFTNVTGLVPGGSYTVTVQNVKDLIGNTIATTNAPFTLTKVGWADVGIPRRPSQVVPVGADGFDILNGGRTEWATYDEVALVYVKKTNDFDVKVQVIAAEPSSQWSRVGLQARNELNAGEPAISDPGANPEVGTNISAYAQTHVNPNQSLGGTGVWPASDPIQPGNANANNGHEQNTRLDTGAQTTAWGTPSTAPEFPNVWLRLRRVGPVITGFRSEDGVTWINQGDVTLTAQTNVMYVGPSHSAETGNIGWTGFNVYADPFDPAHDLLFVAQYTVTSGI